MPVKNDLEREEPLLLNTEPEAANNLTSRALFFQRKLYDKVAFSSADISQTAPLDFWYEKPFYGRSDTDSRAIHISERFLKQFPTQGSESFFAANFVVDAFQDMLVQFAYLRSRGAISLEGPYANPQVTKAWISPHELYHFLMEAVLYDRFKRYINQFGFETRIKDFPSFVKVFVNFINSETPRIPITRSKAILTNKLTPMVSGLAVEVADQSHSEDAPKIEEFINDPNFPTFKEIAMRFGFSIDKHAPWRLIADLGSPAMDKYLNSYDLQSDTVIDRYYYKSHLLDLELLKSYVVEFYNSYVTAKPTVVQPRFGIDRNNQVIVKTKKIERQPEEIEQLDEELGDWFWLRMYTFIRAREENKMWNQAYFEIIVRNAFYYLNGKDLDTAIEYIDRKCKIPSASLQKERDFNFVNTITVI